MGKCMKQSDDRVAKVIAAGLLAGAMLVAAPAGMALAKPDTPGPGDGGRPGQIGEPPGRAVSDFAKIFFSDPGRHGSVPSRLNGNPPGEFIKNGQRPNCDEGPGCS